MWDLFVSFARFLSASLFYRSPPSFFFLLPLWLFLCAAGCRRTRRKWRRLNFHRRQQIKMAAVAPPFSDVTGLVTAPHFFLYRQLLIFSPFLLLPHNLFLPLLEVKPRPPTRTAAKVEKKNWNGNVWTRSSQFCDLKLIFLKNKKYKFKFEDFNSSGKLNDWQKISFKLRRGKKVNVVARCRYRSLSCCPFWRFFGVRFGRCGSCF